MSQIAANANEGKKVYRLVQLTMWSALILVLGLIPNIGFIQLPILPFAVTIIHIPVIIGAIMLGPGAGAFLGLLFGITSIVQATMIPTVTSFLFSPFVPFGSFRSVIVAIVPRVLIGITAGFMFRLIARRDKTRIGAALAAGITGSLTNTVLVLLSLYVLFQDQYTQMLSLPASNIGAVLLALGGVILTNGIAEAVVAAIVVTAVSKALFTISRKF